MEMWQSSFCKKQKRSTDSNFTESLLQLLFATGSEFQNENPDPIEKKRVRVEK